MSKWNSCAKTRNFGRNGETHSGRPTTGDLLKNKKATKKEVNEKINELKGRKDRLQSELVDKKFREHAKSRFYRPNLVKSGNPRLLVYGKVCMHHDDIIAAWSSHFECLSLAVKSKRVANSATSSVTSRPTPQMLYDERRLRSGCASIN